MHIVILAGGKGKRLKANRPKAFVDIAGKSLWYYSLEAASGLKQAAQVSIIFPFSCRSDRNGTQYLETTGRYLTDIVQALEIARDAEELLLINADAVLITTIHLEKFLKLTKAYRTSAVIWPQVRRKIFGPEYGTTDLHPLLGNKGVATGNAILVRPSLVDIETIRSLAQGIPLNKIWTFGIHNLLAAFTVGVSIAKAETIFSRLIHCPVSLPICDIPELGFDIDRPQDLLLAEKIIRSKILTPIG